MVELARRQDPDAVVDLIRANEHSIVAGLHAAGLSRSDPLFEDAQNQALFAIWQQFPFYRGDGSVGGWMYGVSRRVALSRTIDPERRERRRRERNLVRTASHEGTQAGPEDQLVQSDLLDSILERLPAEDCEILRLRAVDELSVREIAGRLFLSEAGAKARLRRARIRAQAAARQIGVSD